VADKTWYGVKIVNLTKVFFKLAITPMAVSTEQGVLLGKLGKILVEDANRNVFQKYHGRGLTREDLWFL